MKIIASASLKGGCGKSTSAVMLASSLPGKVLLIDLDHNNNATDATLREYDPLEISERNIYHVLTGKIKATAAIFHSTFGQGFDVIPAAPILARLSVECAGDPGVLLRFGSSLRRLDYDYIVLDTPPALVLELRAALYAADLVLCPIQLGRWTLQGFDLISAEINNVLEAIGKGPTLRALPAMVSPTEVDNMRELLQNTPFTHASIPRVSSLKNTQNTATAPKDGSIAAEAYMALAKEVQSWD